MAATVCAVFVFVVWVASAYAPIAISPLDSTLSLVVTHGVVYAVRVDLPASSFSRPVNVVVKQEDAGGLFRWWPMVVVNRHWLGQAVQVALWPIVFVLSVLAAWIGYVDRRHPHGHCRVCRYDLTGNESGVCPECGTATQPR
ncbi:MAG: hypothetical protein ACE5E5_01750 [Phycisphaerae bacterium]